MSSYVVIISFVGECYDDQILKEKDFSITYMKLYTECPIWVSTWDYSVVCHPDRNFKAMRLDFTVTENVSHV